MQRKTRFYIFISPLNHKLNFQTLILTLSDHLYYRARWDESLVFNWLILNLILHCKIHSRELQTIIMERSNCELWLRQSLEESRQSKLAHSLDVQINSSEQPLASSAMTTNATLPRRFFSLLSDNKFLGSRHKIENAPISITCRPCSKDGREAHARAFVQSPPLGVVLCTNRLRTKEDIEATVTHELVHCYDIMKQKLDLTQCDNLAYSEVRAAREAECSFGSFLNLCLNQYKNSSGVVGRVSNSSMCEEYRKNWWVVECMCRPSANWSLLICTHNWLTFISSVMSA